MSLEQSQSRQAEQTTKATRAQRARLECLTRMLSRCGFVRSYDLRLNTNNEITGHLKAPARLLRQSLAPVLKARDLSYTTLDQPGEPRGTDDVVTVRIFKEP